MKAVLVRVRLFILAVCAALCWGCSSGPCDQWCESVADCDVGTFEVTGGDCVGGCESASENFRSVGEACGEAFDAYIECGGGSTCSTIGTHCADQAADVSQNCLVAQ